MTTRNASDSLRPTTAFEAITFSSVFAHPANHGADVSEVAHTTNASGRDKGATH